MRNLKLCLKKVSNITFYDTNHLIIRENDNDTGDTGGKIICMSYDYKYFGLVVSKENVCANCENKTNNSKVNFLI